MVELLREAHEKKKNLGGRPNKLSIEKMLLMTVEYLGNTGLTAILVRVIT